MARSEQTLSEAVRRLAAAWAADCAEKVLPIFEAECPGDDRPRSAIARTRAYARGEVSTADEIRKRFGGGSVGRGVSPAATAAARAAGQASAVCHMGAHALGTAAYAARATGLANPDHLRSTDDAITWQIAIMSDEVATALRSLPPIGEDRSGPLGPGLLASGEIGAIIKTVQTRLTEKDLK